MANDLLSAVMLSDAAKAHRRKQQEQMGDVEFQMDIAPYLGYSGEIDPTIARYHGWQGPGRLNLGGFKVPDDFDPENNPSDAAELRRYRYRGDDGEMVQIPIEAGTINAINDQATPQIWAHEYRHKQHPEMSEPHNRLADAVMAQTPADWDNATKLWQDKLRRWDRIDANLADSEADLLDSLEYNQEVTPRGIYKKQYEQGARPAQQKLDIMEVLLDSVRRPEMRYRDEMTDNAIWKRKLENRE